MTNRSADLLITQQDEMAQSRNMLSRTFMTLSNQFRKEGATTTPGLMGAGEGFSWAPGQPDRPTGAGQTDARVHNPNNTRGSLAWGGHANGGIPETALTRISSSHLLEAGAADSFLDMTTAAREAGISLTLSSSYRDFAGQVDIRNRLGGQVATATPGTSNHGWGKAIDVKGARAQAWMRANGTRYGWVWPAWAQEQGTKNYEPWHWEYRPATPTPTNTAPATVAATSATKAFTRGL